MKTNNMHFFQHIRNYLCDYLVVRRKMSDQTVRTYRQSLNQLRQYLKDERGISFTDMDFSCFTRDSIYGFLVWLGNTKNCSVQTLNLRLAAIKSFLRYCSEEDIDLTAVYLKVATIHSFKGTKKPCVEYLVQSQLKTLFSLPDVKTRNGRRDRFFIIFAYETGARMQELLNLKLGDIIRTEAFVKVRIFGKGSKVRYVPLVQSAVKHLDAYIKEFHPFSTKSEEFLFYTIHNHQNTQMTPGTVDYMLKKYARSAYDTDEDFPKNLHAHMLRHSVAMAMYKKGIPISYIKDFLGHSSLDTTAIYSYADDETIVKALESVDHESSNNKGKATKNWKGQEKELLKFCGLS